MFSLARKPLRRVKGKKKKRTVYKSRFWFGKKGAKKEGKKKLEKALLWLNAGCLDANQDLESTRSIIPTRKEDGHSVLHPLTVKNNEMWDHKKKKRTKTTIAPTVRWYK